MRAIARASQDRWGFSSRALLLRLRFRQLNTESVVLRHGLRRGRNSKAVPSSDSIPASAVPLSGSCQSELGRCRAQPLWVGGHGIVVTEPIQLRFDLRVYAPSTKHTDELLLLPTFQQACPEKTKFSRSQLQRCSLPLVFLSHTRFRAKSAAPVSSSCQSRLCSSARRIPQNRAVLASAPFGSAPLRRLTAPPCAPSLAIYETNVFYWPAKAQFQQEGRAAKHEF